MIKGFLILVAIVVLLFLIRPWNDAKNKFFQGNAAKSKEEQIIGRVQGYNPRVWEIQKILKDAHYYAGLIDGVIGKEMREAIKKFQTSKGIKVTGQIDQETHTALIREKVKLSYPSKPVSLKTTKELPSDNNPSVPATVEKSRLESDIISYRMKNQSKTKQIQTALKNSGFFSREIDGRMGPQTKKAIKAFQKSKGIEADGVAGLKTWEELQKYLKP